MIDALKQMMAKKKSPEGKMSEDEITAKMDVIKELLDMAQKAMGDGVKGEMDSLKKVSVMAPDDESLSEGLDLAKDLTAGDAPAEGSEDMPSDEMPTEEMSLSEDSTEDKKEDSDDEFPNIFAQRREKTKRGF